MALCCGRTIQCIEDKKSQKSSSTALNASIPFSTVSEIDIVLSHF